MKNTIHKTMPMLTNKHNFVSVAVVAAFFICWAPFHAQRLLAVYMQSASAETQAIGIKIYMPVMHISGVLYFLSTTINPVLYNIMSNKFRDAFKVRLFGATSMCRFYFFCVSSKFVIFYYTLCVVVSKM